MEGRKVVITGVGIVSCIGVGNQQVATALQEMRSGIQAVPERRELGFRSCLSGVIKEFSPRFKLTKKKRKTMSEFVVWAHDAVMEALAKAGLTVKELQTPRAGLIFGNDSVAAPSHNQAELTQQHQSTSQLHSGMVFRSMNSCISMNLNAILGTRGAAWTISGACASGGHAVGQAADLIALGRQDCIVCGGAQEISWEAVCSFDALGAFSTRENDPDGASRPFDAARDGLVPSGGAAALVLESEDHARRRGAEILGEVLAYAFSSDGGHIAVPTGDGLARCMTESLQRAAVTPASVEYVCAHGTSTPVGDGVEAEAIAGVFGSARPWVSSIKSMTGHEMWMAGASQIVYSLLAAQQGFIPGNRNFETADAKTGLLRIAAESIAANPQLIMCNSAGFGGTNSCLLLRKA